MEEDLEKSDEVIGMSVTLDGVIHDFSSDSLPCMHLPLFLFIFLWLATHDHCWTGDILARRNLPRPDCYPLCHQKETINYLLC
jgi:hypothetical protein